MIIATDRAQRPDTFIRQPVSIQGGRFCPFCPGHESKTPPEVLAYRHNGAGANSGGWNLRVVPNKFPALRVEGEIERTGVGMYDQMSGVGAHEVLIETPEHQASLAELPEKRIEDLFWAFRDRVLDLKRDFRLRYFVLFKNHGEMAGATLEHTHSQLIALPVVPFAVLEEMKGARKHYDHHDRCVYCDILRQELDTAARLVQANEQFVAITPYAGRFPFETWILPRRHQSHFESADDSQMRGLAQVLKSVLLRLDQVLEKPAWNFVIHTSPVQEGPLDHYHWHIEIIPKLTRVAGFEWGTGFYINPTPPEEAAQFLRDARI